LLDSCCVKGVELALALLQLLPQPLPLFLMLLLGLDPRSSASCFARFSARRFAR
jgi:hypothetical protein